MRRLVVTVALIVGLVGAALALYSCQPNPRSTASVAATNEPGLLDGKEPSPQARVKRGGGLTITVTEQANQKTHADSHAVTLVLSRPLQVGSRLRISGHDGAVLPGNKDHLIDITAEQDSFPLTLSLQDGKGMMSMKVTETVQGMERTTVHAHRFGPLERNPITDGVVDSERNEVIFSAP